MNELIILGSITLLRGFLALIIHWEMKSETPKQVKNSKDNGAN